MTHDDSRRLWGLLQTEYAVRHPACGECGNAFDDGVGIWIGKTHDLMRDGKTFDAAWATVQREIQIIEGRYTPPPVMPTGRLRVDGRNLLREDGAPFVWRGVTAFKALQHLVVGNDAATREYFSWARICGSNLVRVLTTASVMFALPPRHGRAALPALLALAAEYGLYVEVVSLADTKGWSWQDCVDHVSAVDAICAATPNALHQLANEPWHATQRPFTPADLRDLLVKAHVDVSTHPVTLGCPSVDESQEMVQPGCYSTVHRDRGRDDWNNVRRIREQEILSADGNTYVVDDEPIGFAEVPRPGARISRPEIAFAQGVLSRVFAVGSTFHCEAGLSCDAPGPVQTACAVAFNDGTRLVPDGERLRFMNATWNDSPVVAFDTTSAVRAYSGIRPDNRTGITVVLGITGDPRVQFGNGWRPTGVVREMSEVKVLAIERG